MKKIKSTIKFKIKRTIKHNTKYMVNLDLLIIDIDDTFTYHRTVALANRLILKTININKEFPKTKDVMKYWYKFLIPNKTQLILLFTGIQLYLFYFIRLIINFFYPIISSSWMINKWAKTIIKLNLNKKDYILTEKVIRQNINQNIFNELSKIKFRKIISLSEHFTIGKDSIENIFNCKNDSNQFFIKNNHIISYKIKISNPNDKLRLAKNYIKKYKAKKIGIIIEDYDDLSLLKLNPIFIISHKRLNKYLPKKVFKKVFN